MDDLELQRLEAIADAARAMCKAASITSYYGIEPDYSDSGYIVNTPMRAWKALADTLNVLDQGREMPEMEYDNGPWATGRSDSCPDCNLSDLPYVDIAGHWCFPNPYASTATYDVEAIATPINPEWARPNISIERCGQGFLACVGRDKLAFTDCIDAAEWLLGWLGFEDEIVESVQDILAGLWDADELYSILADSVPGVDYDELPVDMEKERALDVAGAAQAYVELHDTTAAHHSGFIRGTRGYNRLREAVKKWRVGSREEPVSDPWNMTEQQQADYHKRIHRIGQWADRHGQLYKMEDDHERALDVAKAAWAIIKDIDPDDWGSDKYKKLAEAVKKWRMVHGGTT